MRITFLGTGTSQGVPVVACDCRVCSSEAPEDQRLRSSLMVHDGDRCLIIDAGPDFRQQLLREKVRAMDAILITHEHKDHIGGLDDVRSFNFIQKKAVNVYASAQVQNVIRQCFDYAFSEEKYPGVPEIELHEVRNEAFSIGGTQVIPIELMHYRMSVFGYRIGDFAYLTDMSEIGEDELEKLRGLKVAIVGALRKKIHYSHMNLDQALALIDRIKPEKAYLTHISHLMGRHHEIQPDLPANVSLAWDGLQIEI